jgi:hypothetical protein
METEGRKLHAQAAQAREEGKYIESFNFNDRALFSYDSENDSLGFAEGIACRSLTLRNYANLYESRRLLILAKYEMMASVEIARESGDLTSLALPLYHLGKVQEDLEETSAAVESYQDAVAHMEQNPPESHNRPSVLLDMKISLSAAEYKNGDQEARTRLEGYVHELEQTDEPSQFAKDVWASGGYMKLAQAYKDDKTKSGEYLAKAKEIADNDPELSERRKQIEQLEQSLSH